MAEQDAMLAPAALAALASSSTSCSPIVLLRLRLRFGSPRHIQCGVAFRVAVDLVDEMAQSPTATKSHDGLAIRVGLTAADAETPSSLTLQTRVMRTAPFHWRVDCVVVSPDAAETEPTSAASVPPTLRLRVTCAARSPPPSTPNPHAALQRFCAGSQWVSLPHDATAVALVLPALSDEITIRPPSLPASPATSSRCLRVFSLPKPHGRLYIEEDYGHAMGAHVWDASIWLSLALVETSSSVSPSSVIVELGAGCGLVACVLAKMLDGQSTIIATERRDTLALLRANVSRNGVASIVGSNELRWGSPTPLSGFPPPDVVLAADVLYHWAAHEPLLATLTTLCGASKTRVLLAHKRRGAAAATRLDDVIATGGDAQCPDCAFATLWRVERLARLGHSVDLLQLTRRVVGQ